MATKTDTVVLGKDYKNGMSEFRADFAKFLVHNDVKREILQVDWTKLSSEFVAQGRTAEGLPLENQTRKPLKTPDDLNVGIVGAGIAGLYTAWILQFLGIKWHIIEANSERLGGRLYTHYLSDDKKKHDYYDIGAMRFPDTPIMWRTFDVFKKTKTETGEYLMKPGPNSGNVPSRYNDTTVFGKAPSFDCFKVSVQNGGPVPDDTVRDPDTIMNDAYGRFRDRIKRAIKSDDPNDAKKAWEYLLKHDRFCLRDYLTFVEGESFETAHWLETLNAGTGWFDQAFTENVLESLAFDFSSSAESENRTEEVAPSPDAKAEEVSWRYIVGGSSTLITNVMRKLEGLITKKEVAKEVTDFPNVMECISQGQRVTKMGLNKGSSSRPLTMTYVDTKITSGKEVTPRQSNYDAVFCSTTLGALQKMDLLGLDLPYDTKAAIRSLRYDASTKVAIRFKSQWWRDRFNIKGGLAKTDMPLRCCVYPSYNIDDTGSAILLCSYSWGADSERVASMVRDDYTTKSPQRSDPLMQVMFDNLARLHTTTDDEYNELLSFIIKDFDTYHAFDWTKDPYTCGGAFALFSPSQFSRLYPALVKPLADSRLHIIGEAASAHHAWVVGALDSAARGVYLMLGRFNMREQQAAMIKEFGKIGEVDKETEYLQIALGMLKKEDRAIPSVARAA